MAFTGENFGTLAPVLAVFGADGHAEWQARPPGTVRESWARGALGATSANGELATFGMTFTETAVATERAQILVWNMSTPSAEALLNDSFADGTGIEAILQSESGEVVVAVAAVVGPAGTQHASEVRVYDVCADGSFRRPVGEEEGAVGVAAGGGSGGGGSSSSSIGGGV